MNSQATDHTLLIREALDTDLQDVLAVERAAFGSDIEPGLVSELLADPGAQPLLSLLALRGDRAVGHILFTRVRLEPETPAPAYLLAPMAVVPKAQRQGIGGRLIESGLALLAQTGACRVFVLGYPEYYPRHGFRPAEPLGFEAPYPIAPEQAEAWMVRELRPGIARVRRGRVICCDTLMKPEYWRE